MIEREEEHFLGVVAQKVIIEQDGKVLFVRAKSNEGQWDLPGGRLHLEEKPIDGVMREVREEVGCECNIKGIVHIDQFYHSKARTPCLFITYAGTLPEDHIIKIPDDELGDLTWLPIGMCTPELVYPNCFEAIQQYQKFQL